MPGPLPNARRELFCQELVQGKSQRDAYAASGYKGDRTAACRMAAKADIVERVRELQETVAENVGITRERVLAELAKIGFSDIRKMFTPTGSLKRVEDLDDDAAACLSAIEVVTRKVPGGDEGEVEHVAKIKLWDKRAALVDIGKDLGMFKERVEHSGPDGGPIEISTKDAARRIAFILNKGARSK
jgi:phage terminase small subunit